MTLYQSRDKNLNSVCRLMKIYSWIIFYRNRNIFTLYFFLAYLSEIYSLANKRISNFGPDLDTMSKLIKFQIVPLSSNEIQMISLQSQIDFSHLFLTSSFDWTIKLWSNKVYVRSTCFISFIKLNILHMEKRITFGNLHMKSRVLCIW